MIRLLGCLAAAALGVAAPALAQDAGAAEFHATTLSLSASAEVRARPDLAVITAGVQREAATAADAALQNRREMNSAIQALRGQGVVDADIRTQTLSLEPQYAFENGRPRRLTGYQATNTVEVRLHDPARVGEVVDALVAAGANEINSIGFEISDRTPVENAARRAALKALADKAALYAEASGYRVARLVRLGEGGEPVTPPPRRMALPMAMAASAPTPVAAGELSVSETVSGEYELAPR